MLRKRSRSIQKDQHQMGHLPISQAGSDVLGQNNNSKGSSFFSVPGLFVGLSSKGLIDSDSVRSPTSPLDFRVFSNSGNAFRSPKSSNNDGGQQRSWGSTKVGLSIVDSLDDDDVKKLSGKVAPSSETKNILFGPGMRINKTPDSQSNTNTNTNTNYFAAPNSLPKNYAVFPQSKTKSPLEKGGSDVLFEIGEAPLEPESFGKIRSCSLDSGRAFSTLSTRSGLSNLNPNSTSGKFCLEKDLTTQEPFIGGSPNLATQMKTGSIGSSNGFDGSLSASEIELSEDYTCVISHGANPKTTHIFGDCILGCQSKDSSNFGKNEKEIGFSCPGTSVGNFVHFPANNFLSFCYYCNKKLEEGKDIYIYRGERAFCSLSCRAEEILIDEELEKCNDQSKLLESDEELLETGMIADN